MNLGRNQIINIVTIVLAFAVGTSFVLFGKAAASDWYNWTSTFIPLTVGLLTGGSAAIKVADKLANGKRK